MVCLTVHAVEVAETHDELRIAASLLRQGREDPESLREMFRAVGVEPTREIRGAPL